MIKETKVYDLKKEKAYKDVEKEVNSIINNYEKRLILISRISLTVLFIIGLYATIMDKIFKWNIKIYISIFKLEGAFFMPVLGGDYN